MILEAHKHEFSVFLTVTYNDEFLPKNNSLVPRDLTLFIKRLRRRLGTEISTKSLRYYACGEYGTQSLRPHYHIALFGVGLHHEEDIQAAWTCPDTKVSKGFVYIGTLTLDSAQYIASYIQKGQTKKDQFPDGRYPEFSRMSRRPGIGALAVEDISNSLTTDHGSDVILSHGDVPIALKHGRRSLPLGRYLRRKLREHIGLDEDQIKKDYSQKKMLEMLTLRLEDEALARNPEEALELRRKRFAEKQQKIRNLESRLNARKKGGSI